MKAFLLTFLSLLVSSGCSSGFEIDQIGNGVEVYQSNDVRPNFIDLNTDILYMILHRLELNELLNAAEAMPELSDLIGEVFRRKYLRKKPMIKVYISDSYNSFYFEHLVQFVKNTNTIVITNRQDCVKFFKHIGHFLQNVYIYYEANKSSDLKIINSALNKYCSGSLKQLRFAVVVGVNDLRQLTTPFERVEEFTIRVTEHGLNTSKPLNEIFPSLRRLNVDLETYLDVSFIDKPFPHLNHLYLSTHYLAYGTNTTILIEQLKGVIMKNPTIQSLDIPVNYPPNFMTFLNEALPHLEHLRTSWLVLDDSETVQFDNVKSFGLNVVNELRNVLNVHNFEKISLPNLESLEMWCSLRVYNNLTQFFKRHTKLRQLCLIDHGLFENIPEFNRLIAELPNLVDLTIYDYAYCGIEPIVQLIRSKEHFQKFYFEFKNCYVGSITTTDVTALQQLVRNDWTVKVVEDDGNFIKGFSFERKQLNQQ